MKFRIMNITPLLIQQKDEIIKDILRLRDECGITDIAFILPLHPEEEIPTNAKAEHLRDLFIEMREPLKESGLGIGILIQSVIGHGGFTAAKFTRSINANGVSGHNMCPLDQDFQSYIDKAVSTVAATMPDFLLVDDDFRLSNNGAAGCFCELHLKALENETGRKFDRESLLLSLKSDKHIQKTWDKILSDSLTQFATLIRKAIDKVSPELPCGLCLCHGGGTELYYDIKAAKILAGKKPPFVRIGNAWYLDQDPRGLLGRLYWTSAQMEALKDFPEILSESDTYPQNRYCTTAKALDAQMTFSLLHGVSGAKLWVTRTRYFEADSGEAYRHKLKLNRGKYAELRSLAANVDWRGPAVPIPEAGVPSWISGIWNNNWLCSTLGHMGIPGIIGNARKSNIVMLTGAETELLSDEEIKSFLAKAVLLDGEAALNLVKRGFKEFIGTDVDLPENWRADLERFNKNPINGLAVNGISMLSGLMAGSAVRLQALNEAETVILSDLYSSPWYICPVEEKKSPGVLLFENAIGGRIAVCAAKLSFLPFMNESRREQLIGILSWLNRSPFPAIAASDIDIYAMYGNISDKAGGGKLLALFNLSLDSLEKTTLRLAEIPKEISCMKEDGNWELLNWHQENQKIILDKRLESVTPLILRLK